SVLEVVAAVGVEDLGRLRPDEPVVTAWQDLRLSGTVSAVPPGVDGETGLGTVRLRLEGGGPPVGAIVEARVAVGSHEGWSVPTGAVRRGGAGHEVVLCEAGLARGVPVTLGEVVDGRIEIRGELPDVVRVLADGSLPVDDGATITEIGP
ncbi:MAG: hypothetical protein KC621_18130, partial [Myxococcales bacterium]|nr:hypothetical protein [Myxococcales bacterium]